MAGQGAGSPACRGIDICFDSGMPELPFAFMTSRMNNGTQVLRKIASMSSIRKSHPSRGTDSSVTQCHGDADQRGFQSILILGTTPLYHVEFSSKVTAKRHFSSRPSPPEVGTTVVVTNVASCGTGRLAFFQASRD